MGDVPAQVLPLAVAAAASPLPLVVMLVVLLTPRAAVNGTAFLAGWASALLLLAGATVALFGAAARVDEESTAVSALEVAVGAGLLVLAAQQWRHRPRAGTVPGWLQSVDQWTVLRAFGMGGAVLGVSPKNLTLTVTAAGVVAGTSGAGEGTLLPLAVFVALGSAGLALPLVLRLCLGHRVGGLLGRCRGWLLVHGHPVACGLAVLLGGLLVVRGAT